MNRLWPPGLDVAREKVVKKSYQTTAFCVNERGGEGRMVVVEDKLMRLDHERDITITTLGLQHFLIVGVSLLTTYSSSVTFSSGS